ncbi:MAG: thioredoxin-disulfide reductase [Candidatus Levybacteria bacterium]|nr:thioredoxin-disulfide reductase [Candidatus Levybacteria bacterium]
MEGQVYDVVILGSGPAGLTAAIYTTRASLKTLIIAGERWGGQLMLTTLVENYPGFPDGIQGPDLMIAMRKQAEHHGAEIVEKNFVKGDFTSKPFKITAGDTTYESKTVIIATGADTKWLGVPGEQELIGRGVSSCAPCDAPFFRNKRVIVAGGGDSAMEEALVLSRAATQVFIVHRRDTFRASQIMQDKVKASEKIKTLFNTEILEIKGEGKVASVMLKNNQTGQTQEMPIDGVFVAIGHKPNSTVFNGIKMDESGYIVVHDYYQTNVAGVFVAGDVHDNQYRQAITAAGFGCAAALEAERWLRDQQG